MLLFRAASPILGILGLPNYFSYIQCDLFPCFQAPPIITEIEILKCRRLLKVANYVDQLMYLCKQSRASGRLCNGICEAPGHSFNSKMLTQSHFTKPSPQDFHPSSSNESNPQVFILSSSKRNALKCPSGGRFSKVFTKYSRKYVVDI
jgi:hypothetical protein